MISSDRALTGTGEVIAPARIHVEDGLITWVGVDRGPRPLGEVLDALFQIIVNLDRSGHEGIRVIGRCYLSKMYRQSGALSMGQT